MVLSITENLTNSNFFLSELNFIFWARICHFVHAIGIDF